MTAVLIALADVGPAMPLEEQLAGAGLAARWDATQADGPRGDVRADVVIVDADRLSERLAEVAAAWRERPGVPGVIALGISPAAREHAPHARTTLLAPSATLPTLVAAIRDAARLRYTAAMRWPILRAALGLPAAADDAPAWQPTLAAARTVDLDVPRAALRWHARHYATPTARLDQLREERVLTVPELETIAAIDGTRTVQTLVRSGPLDAPQAARLLWTLGGMGALDFTPEIRDVATPVRRLVAELRAHLRARVERLEGSTYYDVLELTPLAEYEEIEDGYRLVAMRFSPEALAGRDLADLAGQVQPMWELVEKARAVLVDHAARGRYHDWLRQHAGQLRTVWAIEPTAIKTAGEAFVRGQRHLVEGDPHRAMSDLATACRHHPGHPEYEASLAWARYRVFVASGRDRVETARAERATIEDLLLGCRPWPRALVPLALLCAAANDADSARWHVHTALTVEPGLPAAVQLAQRLGLRR